MTALANLIRISRWHLDEKRQKLGDLERLAERLEQDLARLDEGIARERELAERDEEAQRAFPAYYQAERQRRDRINQSIADVKEQIETAREEVGEAFRELKKYEMAKANQDERDRRRQERQQQQAMDELGAQMHRRRRSQGQGSSG